MKCEKIKQLLPDYLKGTLDSKIKLKIDEHLSECADCEREFEEINLVWSKLAQIPEKEPSAEMHKRFYSMLEEFGQGLNPASINVSWDSRLSEWFDKWWPRKPVFQLGISMVCLIFGLLVGQIVDFGIGSKHEMAQLKEEVREVRMVTLALLDQSSAAERIKGLTMSRSVNNPDEQFLSLLLLTLNSDTNVNVRLAAVDALYRFCDNSWLRTELVKSLSIQTSPLVQISLIDLLADIQEQKAIGMLKKLSDDQHSIEAVKTHARWGIKQII